jgi:HEAT repeat protein
MIFSIVLLTACWVQDTPSGDELRAALTHKEAKIRIRAAEQLDKYDLKSDPKMWPVAMAALKDSDADVRERVANALRHLRGTKMMKPVVKAMISILSDDSDNTVRGRAMNTLAFMGSEAQEAVPTLMKALADKDPQIRAGAACVLYQLAPKDKEVVLRFVELTKDPVGNVRATAACGLGQAIGLGVHKDIAIPALVRLLGDADEQVRRCLVTGIDCLGAAAAGAVKTLEKMSKEDPDSEVRFWAAKAVKKIRRAMEKQADQ